MFAGQMFNLIVAFFIGAWLARHLGPHNYGILNYVFAFVGIFTFIANLGIGTILSRDLVRHPEKQKRLLGTSFILLSFGGLFAYALIVLSAIVFETDLFIRSLIMLYGLSFLWSAFGIIQIFFQSNVQAKKIVRVSICIAIISSILKVVLILKGEGLIWLVGILIFETLLNAILSIIVYMQSGHSFTQWRFDREIAKTFLTGGFLLMLAAGASFLFTKVDQVMVKYFIDETAVGLYAAAVRLVEIWYFVPSVICTSLLPAIVNAKKVSERAYRQRLVKLCILLAGMAILIAIPSTIFAPTVVHLLFGSEYAGAAAILRIYTWSGVGLFVLWGLQQYFLTENRLLTIFLLYFFSMALNIALNFVMIPQLGLSGAAWATLISYSVGPCIIGGFLYFKRFFTSR